MMIILIIANVFNGVLPVRAIPFVFAREFYMPVLIPDIYRPEVHQLQLPFRGENDVGRLQVTMHKPLFVELFYCCQQLG